MNEWDSPPIKFRLVKGNEHIARFIGIKFNGKIRHNDVYAYDAVEGWIEQKDGTKLYGSVEPFLREAPATLTPAPTIAPQTEEQKQANLSAAEEKRRRKAEKLAKMYGQS